VAVVYRSGERYRRALADPAGDHCVWIIPSPQLAPAMDQLDADPAAPRFRPAGRRAYAVQRLIASALARGRRLDPLLVEEQLSAVVADTLERVPAARPRRTACDQAAEQARAILASRYAESLSLGDVAREVHASPYHLTRRFRRLTGSTLHAYRNTIRLRRGLGLACEGERDLGRVAAEVGYSSHSHFTDSFRREFGLPPSWLRAATTRELRSILEALPAARP
jgi:AraC family transcriptional regulator